MKDKKTTLRQVKVLERQFVWKRQIEAGLSYQTAKC